jgi:bifunctional oligoribonuclease and PAP phosphatase NrnA
MALNPEQQAVEFVSRAKSILVITKDQASTDAISAAMALGFWLKKLNKTFDLVIPGKDIHALPGFLPSNGIEISPQVGAMRAFHIRLKVEQTPLSELMYDVKDGTLDITLVPKHGAWSPQDVAFSYGQERYDLVIALGSPDMASLGPIATEYSDFLYRTTIINIDHHSTNEHWGQINLVDLNAVSTTEVLYQWLNGWNQTSLDERMATALLAGMIAETKSFRTANVTPKTLSASSNLVALGADRAKINHTLWRTRSIETLKLWGRALSRLQYDRELGLVWTLVNEADLIESGAKTEALSGVVDELIGYAPEAKVVLLISQQKDRLQVSLHTTPPISAAELARPFNGNGTKDQAIFSFQAASLQEGSGQIIERMKQMLKAGK